MIWRQCAPGHHRLGTGGGRATPDNARATLRGRAGHRGLRGVLRCVRESYVPLVLDPEGLTEGFGKLGASASFAQVSGRGLASGLVVVIGAARAVAADALSYAVSVTCLLLVKADEPRPERRPAGARQLRRDIPQGLAFIARHPVLRKITACTAAGNLLIAMEIALNLLFLIRVLHMRPAFAGLATALGSLGGIAGGMLAASLARRIGSARIIWFSLLVLDAPSLVLPLAEPGWRIALFRPAMACPCSLVPFSARPSWPTGSWSARRTCAAG